jgi:hypothetical protein
MASYGERVVAEVGACYKALLTLLAYRRLPCLTSLRQPSRSLPRVLVRRVQDVEQGFEV